MANELQQRLAEQAAGSAPDERRAIYDQAREALQAEIRAAAPFMPVQTVIERRRALENAILAVEREESRKDPLPVVVQKPQAAPAPKSEPVPVEALVTASPAPDLPEPEHEASAPEPEAHPFEPSPLPPEPPVQLKLDIPPEELVAAMEMPLRPAMTYSSSPPPAPIPRDKATVPVPAAIAQPDSLAAAPEVSGEIGEDIPEDVQQFLAAEKRRRSLTIYLGVVGLILCAAALAGVLIGLGFEGTTKDAKASAPRPPAKAALPAPARPEAQLMKDAGFGDAAQRALKEGNARLGLKDFAGAIASFDDAIRLDPNNSVALGNRAYAYWSMNDVKAAVRDYGAAIDRDPANATLRFNRAVALNSIGEHAAAVADLDRVLAADRANADALNGRCWARAVLAHFEEALADCNESLKLRPGDMETLDSRGFVHLRLGRLDRAIADYSDVLRQQPKHAGALYGRGLARIGRGDRAGGQEDVTAARAVDPDIVAKFSRYGIR